MQTGTLEIDGKIVFQWNCEDPAECSHLPYLRIKDGQKFVLSWLVTDMQETFDLKVNNQAVSSYNYLDSSFKLEDDQVTLFQASIKINKHDVTKSKHTQEHLPGILTHKILEKVADVTPVTKI